MRGAGRRTMSLHEAASVVFGLAAILPILLFVYLLSRADLLRQNEAQIGLVLAVVVSVLGFLVFRRLVGQIERLAEGLQAPKPTQPVAAPDEGSLGSLPGLGR